MLTRQTRPVPAFLEQLGEFVDCNRQRRTMELQGEAGTTPEVLNRWEEARWLLTLHYKQAEDRVTLERALADPYFPLSMLHRLNAVQFVAEPQLAGLPEPQLAAMLASHLLEWARIFLSIRGDLAGLNRDGRVSSLGLTDSAQESLPEGGWCDYCGGCCEIRGGPPEFTGDFTPPSRWLNYFHGDACEHQRFCPFLFEYFATGRFFCSIYHVKPRCCWTFGRDECEFLKMDVARQRTARSNQDHKVFSV
jgi:hypothetical protein